MDAFRYPLAGRFSMDLDVVRRVRIPYDWALEIGMLSEVFRNCAPRAICRSELCENYNHQHQDLSVRDASRGLSKMAVDIARSFFNRMAAEGIKLDTGVFDTLLSAYMRQAEDTLRFSTADAALNGLKYPRHEEETAVTTFVRSIRVASEASSMIPWACRTSPTGTASIPRSPPFSTSCARPSGSTTKDESDGTQARAGGRGAIAPR